MCLCAVHGRNLHPFFGKHVSPQRSWADPLGTTVPHIHSANIHHCIKIFPNLEYCEGGGGEWWVLGAVGGVDIWQFWGSHKNTSKLHCYCLKFCRLLYNLMLFWKPLLLLVILEWMAMVVYSETKPNIKFRMRLPARLSYVIFVDRTAALANKIIMSSYVYKSYRSFVEHM